VPADADWTVDVVVHDQLPGVFQPLSAEDVGSLLSTLPADIGAELRGVHLRLGRLEDDMKQDGAEPDPMTGRPGYEEGPVWTPPLRGRWRSGPAEIDLFGYVYDPRKIAVPELLAPILWLFQAEALAHEVWSAALEWTALARELFPGSVDARLDRIDALIGSASWNEALREISDGLTSVAAAERAFHRHARRSRALLASEQGFDDVLAADVTWLREEGTPLDHAAADAIEAEWNLRRGRVDEARRIARQALKAQRKPPGIWGAIIRAAAWETAADNSSREHAKPSERDIELLIGNGRLHWVERLRTAGLVPRAGRSRRQADLMRRRGPLVRL
jgi:hypothetical protein